VLAAPRPTRPIICRKFVFLSNDTTRPSAVALFASWLVFLDSHIGIPEPDGFGFTISAGFNHKLFAPQNITPGFIAR
jgi:hypothetical protein